MTDNLMDILLTAGADDNGNAECAVAVLGKKYLWSPALGWLCWTGNHWSRLLAQQKLEDDLMTLLKMRAKLAIDKDNDAILRASKPSAAHLRSLKETFYYRVSIDVGEFDMQPDLVNVANGVLNLRTGELSPHSSEQHFTYCIGTEYDPDADDTLWTNFLWDTLSDHTDTDISRKKTAAALEFLQMAIGYSLTGHTNEEKMFYIEGPARSGKGTFTETLLALIDAPLATETDFSTFTAKRESGDQGFDLAPLKPARIVFASESNKEEWLNTGKVKRLTGGNYIRAAFKHKDIFTFRPQFKIWLTSNHGVRADVDDDAVWDRIYTLHFPNGHSGAEDKSLKQRMRSPENLRGVLRWIVDGARKWYESPRGLIAPEHILSASEKARDAVDYVAVWLAECTEKTDDWTPNSSVYQSYSNWCEENGVSRKNQRGLALSLQKKGYKTGEIERIGVKTHRGVRGLRIR